MTSPEFIDWADPARSTEAKSFAQRHRRRKVRLQAQAMYEAQRDWSREFLVRIVGPPAITSRENENTLLTPEPEDAVERRSATGKYPWSDQQLVVLGKVEDNDGTIVLRSRSSDCENACGELSRCI